jgi:hypothetical protein
MDFGLSRLIRYNGKRQVYYQKLHRLTSFINALLASSAFVTILSGGQGALWLTAGVAILSAADSVIGFAERAKLYGDLRRRYFDLYCELLLTKPEIYDEDEFRQRRLRIDRDGPPPLRVLDVISRNEEDIARGFKPEETIFISWPRRAVCQVFDLAPKEWETLKQREKRRRARLAKRRRGARPTKRRRAGVRKVVETSSGSTS